MGALHQAMLMTRKAVAGSGLPVTDDFNRADSTTTLGTSTSGHVWVPFTSTVWGISSNKAYIQNSAGPQTIAYVESGAGDVTIEATVHKTDATNSINRMGVAFRVSDEDNYLFAYFVGTNALRIHKVVAGSGSQIGTGTVTFANNSVLKVVLSGTSIEAFQNGVSKVGPITESFNQTATKHGIMWEAGGQAITVCRWEDFSIV